MSDLDAILELIDNGLVSNERQTSIESGPFPIIGPAVNLGELVELMVSFADLTIETFASLDEAMRRSCLRELDDEQRANLGNYARRYNPEHARAFELEP